MVQYIEKDFKSILNKHKFIDNWFWGRYGINTYNGCQFGCIYCDSRSEKYHLPTDFENQVIIKNNVKEMLDKRIAGARTLLPDVVCLCGTTDPYQGAEVKSRNTRQCLQVLHKYKYPVHIITKSPLVKDDLDLLGEIARESWCTVSVTITSAHPGTARFLEQRAPPPQARFQLVKEIKKHGHIQAGINFIPIVPFLCDSEENMEAMVKKAKEAEADFILFGGMTMRDLQAQWFMKHLRQQYPELEKKFDDLYMGMYAPSKKSYTVNINKRMLALCEKYGIPTRIKRFIPGDFRKYNYLAAEQFLNEAYELQALGKAWTNLFWAGQNINNLPGSLVEISKRGELQGIRNVNPEIEGRIRDFLTNNGVI
jgi:DNA repair photolyase